jgi:hypothetical protein
MNSMMTNEQSMHTDEQCRLTLPQRFRSFNEHELNDELQKVCVDYQWTDVQAVLAPSFDAQLSIDTPVISLVHHCLNA